MWEPVRGRELAEIRCAPGEVHVWRIELDSAEPGLSALTASLSPAEQAKAARFRTPQLRERWVVSHGALRYILGRYARLEPSALRFEPGPNGKPDLYPPVRHISFNVCHSAGLALVAVAAGERIGIDAEIVRTGIDVENLSRRFFTPAEVDEILGLASESRLAAFFACWTRKEAILKALGSGLAEPLDRFQVTVRPDEPARLVSGDGEPCDRWTLLDVSEDGVAAALAIEGRAPTLRRLKFEPPAS